MHEDLQTNEENEGGKTEMANVENLKRANQFKVCLKEK